MIAMPMRGTASLKVRKVGANFFLSGRRNADSETRVFISKSTFPHADVLFSFLVTEAMMKNRVQNGCTFMLHY